MLHNVHFGGAYDDIGDDISQFVLMIRGSFKKGQVKMKIYLVGLAVSFYMHSSATMTVQSAGYCYN